MDVVIDANELFSCVIAHGKGLASKTIEIFFDDRIKLHAPTKLLEELKNNEDELAEKSGLSVSEYEVFLAILKLRISFVPLGEFGAKLREAEPFIKSERENPHHLWVG
jgi:predicted nucleic acid-binding protein